MRIDGADLIIGVGNEYRRDDGAGLMAAAALENVAGLSVLSLPGEGTELINAWSAPGLAEVVVIDAMRSDDPPGQIRYFDVVREPLPVGTFSCSSHRFGLAEAVEMARILGRLPRRLTIVGVSGLNFSQGVGLTPVVAAAISRVVETLALGKIRV